MSITVVGSVALDNVSTPFGRIEEGLGGAATHFSVSASFFTKAINLVAIVGSDFPREHVEFLRDRGINLDGLQIADGKTFRWSGKYDYDLNNAQTLDTQLNVFDAFKPKLPDAYKKPKILFLANINPELQLSVIKQVERPELVAMDTMNLWINIKKSAVLDTIGLTDLLVINETEARLLTGEHNLVKAARQVQSWGPDYVVIKRGEYGALLFYKEQIFNAPAYPLDDIFDPTGAGDSFAGGLIGYLIQHGSYDFESFKTAVICGSVMASFNVEKFSCDRFRTLTQKEICERFNAFQNLSHFTAVSPF